MFGESFDLLIIYVNDYDICGYGVSLGRVLIQKIDCFIMFIIVFFIIY